MSGNRVPHQEQYETVDGFTVSRRRLCAYIREAVRNNDIRDTGRLTLDNFIARYHLLPNVRGTVRG